MANSYSTIFPELELIARALAYPNLSTAAKHIGLSQPQLSRTIRKIEDEMGLPLLDRSSKRKSGWTPTAVRLVEIFTQSTRSFSVNVEMAFSPDRIPVLRLGTLEGLSGLAMKLAQDLHKKTKIETIELDVHDLDRLDQVFLKGQFDLIFTARAPSDQKFVHELQLGTQTLDWVGNDKTLHVLSPFESHGRKSVPKGHRRFVSNSLSLRRQWLNESGGYGIVPSEVRGRGTGVPVLLIGGETLPPKLWTIIVDHYKHLKK